MTTYSSRVYHEQGGDRLVVQNGGEIMHEGHAAVTQITSITTGVTANALSGTITTVSQTIAAAAEADFVVTNSRVAATDTVVACVRSTASAGTFIVAVAEVAAGQFTLRLTNLHAANAGNNTILINFFVIKARA
jgi:hypothetical protein